MTDLSLVVRRTIRAPVARVFEAWTDPAHLQKWWGPRPVVCAGAEVDLREGGAYRIGNRLPDGKVVWITGEFERVKPPDELVYTWRIEPNERSRERVRVRFVACQTGTEVIVVHENIEDPTARAGHEAGWRGCLDGLELLFAPS
jgi:uncharacterized protein YndB with AHSA1/START domain